MVEYTAFQKKRNQRTKRTLANLIATGLGAAKSTERMIQARERDVQLQIIISLLDSFDQEGVGEALTRRRV